MTIRTDQQGYCPSCLTNVEHVRSVKSALLKLIDRASFRIPELFGLGPWYCVSCGKRRWLFPPYRRSVGSYDPNPQDDIPNAESEIESMGNVFISAVSLVHRSNRAKYYSEKFRDGIVERLLSCSATFSQVRQRLGITDLDLQDWISRYHQTRLCSPALRVGSVADRDAPRGEVDDDPFDHCATAADSQSRLRAKAD